MNFKIQYTNQEITPWSGFVFLKQMMGKMGFRDKIKECSELPLPGSNRGYHPYELIESFIVSIWSGANKFSHIEITRLDKPLTKIFDWKQIPGNDAFKRFFRKFTMETNAAVAQHFFSWIIQQLQIVTLTLDFDSTTLTRYGQQEGAKKGYNPKKKGRASHHPLIAFIADLRIVANVWLRSGDASSSNNFAAFLEDTLNKLQGKKVGLIRMDSGFFSKGVLDFIEGLKINYIVSVRFYKPIQRMISLRQNWLPIDKGIEICETTYQAEGWEHPRRLIVVRQKLEDRPTAVGKTLNIFEGTQDYNRHRYSAYVTDLALSPAEVWRLYRGRADSENCIKETKEDFGLESFNLQEFYPTEAALIFVMIAYNLMAIFRLFILKSEVQHTLSTLRFKVFAIGAYFQKINGEYHLKIALSKKRRKWFEALWNNGNNSSPPFGVSNA